MTRTWYEMLGHISVTITLTIYSHVLPKIQRDAADAMNRLAMNRLLEDKEEGPQVPDNV